jgi:error-prone DNA polymerase
MRYAELHCKTNFSFLEGASHADELTQRAAELGYSALAVTDRDSLAGVVRAHTAAKELGLKLLIGAEVHPIDALPVVLWATGRKSYGRLSRLLTVGRRRAEKGQCRLTLEDIAGHAEGLVAGVIGWSPSGKLLTQRRRDAEEVNPSVLSLRASAPLRENIPARNATEGVPYSDIFPRRCYLLAELFRGPDDAAELERLIGLS